MISDHEGIYKFNHLNYNALIEAAIEKIMQKSKED